MQIITGTCTGVSSIMYANAHVYICYILLVPVSWSSSYPYSTGMAPREPMVLLRLRLHPRLQELKGANTTTCTSRGQEYHAYYIAVPGSRNSTL